MQQRTLLQALAVVIAAAALYSYPCAAPAARNTVTDIGHCYRLEPVSPVPMANPG